MQNRVEMGVRADRSSEAKRSGLLAAIVIIFLTLTFFLIQYDQSRTSEPWLQAWYQVKRAGTIGDVDRYRIAVPFLAHYLEDHTPLKMRQSIPLIESLCYGLGLAALCLLLVDSTRFQSAPRMQRLLMYGFLFAAIQFPVLWIFPWGRPETLPTLLYLAAATLVITTEAIDLGFACLLILTLSLMQSFARTDAPVVVGVACLLAAAFALPLRRSRTSISLLGLVCAMSGGVVQLYLSHLFPQKHGHQPTAFVQLFSNLNPFLSPFHFPELFTALLPILASLLIAWRLRMRLDGTDKLTLLISLLYLPLYFIFGIVSEIRLYVPYLFLLAPVIAKLWAQFLWTDPANSATA